MKILVCPLNWGLGHATRCVPIVRQLLSDGHEPVLVSDGYPLTFLQQEFPSLRIIEYPSYPIHYSSGKSQIGAIFRGFPNIVLHIFKEHFWLKKLLKEENFEQIISDNRFGLWNEQIQSVYITHQIMVKMPQGLKFIEPFVFALHRLIIQKYDECWIPDVEGNKNLSGDLSHKHKLPQNAKYIGTLSRFSTLENIVPDFTYDVVGIVSGPEPQRTIFEKQLIEKYCSESFKTLIAAGQPKNMEKEHSIGNTCIFSHLPDHKLAAFLKGSRKIVCRSGYSTLMDLQALNCLEKAEFIPTPGQTEQEYLAEIHSYNTKIEGVQ